MAFFLLPTTRTRTHGHTKNNNNNTNRDTIQRARYVAQDRSYTQWPPCLRLFHPFGADIDSLAFAVAACIEEYQIESFEVCLSEWSIIPHSEAMELQWWRTQSSNQQQQEEEHDASDEEFLTVQQRKDRRQQQAYEAMVERLVKRGKIRQRQRREKLGLEPLPELEDDYEEGDETSLYREFDGPCVLCLEPDLESRADLMTLRAVLQQEAGMAPYSPFCPTATVDPSLPPVARFVDFRPVIPIASFGTVSEAIPVAKKLRKVWEPLTWEVTDLQILASQALVTETDETTTSTTTEEESFADPSLWLFRQKVTKAKQDDSLMMGCSALIMLYGEEMDMDDELNQEIANLVAQKGEDGGFGRQQQSTANSAVADSTPMPSMSSSMDSMDIQNGGIKDIEAYLANEDEDAPDEGTVVVIGRVHFFTGDARIYQGMPATSTRQETSTITLRRPGATNTSTTEGTKVDDDKKN